MIESHSNPVYRAPTHRRDSTGESHGGSGGRDAGVQPPCRRRATIQRWATMNCQRWATMTCQRWATMTCQRWATMKSLGKGSSTPPLCDG
jgi:hypothetical protein